MSLSILFDIAQALYFHTSKMYSAPSTHAIRFARANLSGMVAKMRADWDEMHSSGWTTNERILAFGIVWDIIRLVPTDKLRNIGPNETLLEAFPMYEEFEQFAATRFGGMFIFSRNRNIAPHDGNAIDVVGTNDSEWETLARVWLLKNQSGVRPGESCSLGIRGADKHMHLDKAGYGVFVELSKNPIVSRMKSAVTASEWEGYVAEVKQRYSVTEHRFDFIERKPTGIGKIIIISSLVWFFLLREKK